MRLFIALNFKPSGQTELVKLIDTLQKEGVSGRAIPQENLHVTIAFFRGVRPGSDSRHRRDPSGYSAAGFTSEAIWIRSVFKRARFAL